MFKKFEEKELEEWNKLTENQKEKMINENDVDFAVDIEVTMSCNGRLLKELKFYDVDRYFKKELGFIEVKEISLTKTIISINNQLIELKIDEEKEIIINRTPFIETYKVKVSNLKYGVCLEL